MKSVTEKPPSIIDYVQKCVYCGYCSLCPTFKELGWETNHPRGILQQISEYYSERSTNDLAKGLFDAVFNCTLCGACQNICIADIPLVKIWEEIRQESFRKGRWNKNMTTLTDNVRQTHNIYGLDPEDRLGWTKYCGINLTKRTGIKAPVIYYIGCQASYSGKVTKIAESIIAILRKGRVKFAVLGPDEWCCGSPIFLGGGYQIGKSLAEHNLEAFKKLGAKTVVVSCAGCYKTFKNTYPEILGEKWDIEVLHITEYMMKLIKEGKIKITQEFNQKVTYKDPCELARHCGFTEKPREVIQSIPNIRFEELPSNRDQALCCGGGGLLKVNNSELVKDVNEKLMEEIKYTEADIVVNSCPECQNTITQGIKRHNLDIESIDLSELIYRVIGVKK